MSVIILICLVTAGDQRAHASFEAYHVCYSHIGNYSIHLCRFTYNYDSIASLVAHSAAQYTATQLPLTSLSSLLQQ